MEKPVTDTRLHCQGYEWENFPEGQLSSMLTGACIFPGTDPRDVTKVWADKPAEMATKAFCDGQKKRDAAPQSNSPDDAK